MGDKEEGEVSEEGELPDENEEAQAAAPADAAASAPAPAEAQPASAAPDAAAAPAANAAAAADQPQQQPPPGQQQQQQHTTLSRPKPEAMRREQQKLQAEQHQHHQHHHHPASGPGAARDGRSSREQQERSARERRGSGAEQQQQQDRHRSSASDREKAELSQELDKLTADLTFQEIRTNWATACPNIKAAIKKLDKLLRRVKKKREDDVELYPPCFEFAVRILAALKHVLVITSTGLGKTVDMELGHNIMKTAVNYRHDILSAAQKRELEAAIRESKEFQYLFTDRDKGRSSSKAAAAPANTAAAAAAGTAGTEQQQQQDEQQQQRVPLARGDRAGGQQQQQQQRGATTSGDSRGASLSPTGSKDAAAAAGGSGPPEGEEGAGKAAAAAAAEEVVAAPPPPDPPQEEAAAAAADGAAAAGEGDTQQQQQQTTPVAAVVVGGGRPVPATAAVSRAPSIKIVVNSTAVGAAAAAGETAAAAGAGWPPVGSSPHEAAAVGAAGGGGHGVGGGGGAGSSGSGAPLSGAKRGAVEIRDLLDDDFDDGGGGGEQQQQQQASKRLRLDSPHHQQQQQQQVNGTGQQQQQQQQVPPWESEEHRRALDSSTPLQGVVSRLLESQRLVLVLDLDHTLVNSVKFSEVDPEWEYRLEQQVAEQLLRPREAQDLHRLVRMGMWTKLRPGVRQFLKRAAERFELWIYTAGSKPYADAMAELLDPAGRYFGGRVIAQGAPTAPDEAAGGGGGGGGGGPPEQPLMFKRLLQGLEGCEPVVLIVDDSSAVWPNDRRNLFIVERYIYFPSSRKRLGMQGRSLMEVDRDECPQRGMLMTALRVFEALHAAVFARLPQAPLSTDPSACAVWDVRNVMAAEKKRVLEGVQLVFSRVIPLETNPRQHPLWLLAEQYGATCTEQCTDDTTHVVAMTGGTEKVMWARQNNKFVVGPAWLECSCIVWQRAAEERFPPPQ